MVILSTGNIGIIRMDSDIKHILEEEQRLALLADDSRKAARKRVEEHRAGIEETRESEFKRIADDYDSMTGMKLKEIRKRMDNELKEMKEKQEHLLDETELKNKITGRIVSVILENRR